MAFDRKGFYGVVGRLMKRHREHNDLTQKELAEVLEMPRSTYANIERGKQRAPADVLWRVAVHLGIPFNALLPRPSKTEEPAELGYDSAATTSEAPGRVATGGAIGLSWLRETSGSGGGIQRPE